MQAWLHKLEQTDDRCREIKEFSDLRLYVRSRSSYSSSPMYAQWKAIIYFFGEWPVRTVRLLVFRARDEGGPTEGRRGEDFLFR
jgi:hypothetical protein